MLYIFFANISFVQNQYLLFFFKHSFWFPSKVKGLKKKICNHCFFINRGRSFLPEPIMINLIVFQFLEFIRNNYLLLDLGIILYKSKRIFKIGPYFTQNDDEYSNIKKTNIQQNLLLFSKSVQRTLQLCFRERRKPVPGDIKSDHQTRQDITMFP